MRIYNILYMNIMYKNWMYMSTEIECWRTRANYLLRALAVCWCTATAVLRCSNCSILTCKITLSSWRKTFLCSALFWSSTRETDWRCARPDSHSNSEHHPPTERQTSATANISQLYQLGGKTPGTRPECPVVMTQWFPNCFQIYISLHYSSNLNYY